MTSNIVTDLNSFNDVANYIAKENEKLSSGIVQSLKLEIAGVRNEFNNQVDTLSHNLKTNIERVDDIHSSHSKRITRLEDTIARMQRNAELVMSGIPPLVDESCSDIVRRIAVVIGIDISPESFSAFRLRKTGIRLRHNNRGNAENDSETNANAIHPIILVKFISPNDKVKFIEKYLAHKSLCLKDVGFQSEQRIFIKENLTPHNYKIFQACASAKRNNQVSKFHTRDGICYVTLPSSEKSVAVHSTHYLNEIIGANMDQNPSQLPNQLATKRKLDVDHNGPQSRAPKKTRKQRIAPGQPLNNRSH